MKRVRFVALLLVCLWGAASVAAPEEDLSPTEQAARYREAAEQGDAEAQNNLGTCYATGEGVAQSYEEALKWGAVQPRILLLHRPRRGAI